MKIDNSKGEWTERKIFGEDTKEIFYCEDANTNKLLGDIVFLYRKLQNLKLKIEAKYEDFVKHLVHDFKEDMKKGVKNIKKDGGMEVKLEQVFESSKADNELFFYLDTFFIDLKRIIEFSFRLIARFDGVKEMKNFSLDRLMLFLSGQKSPSEFASVLMRKYPSYVEFILSNKKWINSLNYKRTRSIHYEIFNKTGGFKIEYFWNSVMTLEDEPIITFPTIPMFNRPILELVNENTDNLRQFINKTLSLRQDLIKKHKII